MEKAKRFVDPLPPRAVTSIDHKSETDPRDVGLTALGVNAIWKSVEQCYLSGTHPAISVCVRHRGQIIINRAIGHTHGNAPGDPANAEKRQATPDSLFNLFSASKAIAAVIIHHLDERGLINLEDPLCQYLPEFSEGSKQHITIRHLLLHQAGMPTIPKAALDLDKLHTQGEVKKELANMPLKWQAGRRTAYHAVTAGFLMGELVEVASGLTIREYLDRYFLQPLGFNTFNFGVPDELVADVAPNTFTGRPLPYPLEKLAQRILGVSYQEAIDLSNDHRFLTGIVPAANIIGTAEETSRFYELLLREGTLDNVQVLKPHTVRRAVAEQVNTRLDRSLGIPMRYSLGFMLGRPCFSLYQGHTPRAFGHLGLINITGYADPDRDISVAILNNGKPGLAKGSFEFLKIMRSIAENIPSQMHS
ncbi:MAG: beta-lactamase family protein [Pseudomonadales bacterium]|nr:beta-lactamase family protein [Pseudomonadales bacterium]